MPNFNTQATLSWEMLEADAFGAGGRTVEYRIVTAKLVGGDRQHQQVHTISADLSAHAIPIDPLGSGFSTSNSMMLVNANRKIDLRIGDSTNTPISGTQLVFLTGTVSALYVTTGSLTTIVRTVLVGGSGGGLTISPPLV
jgi:hypothetical protein